MINFATIGSNFIVENLLENFNQIDGYFYYGAYSRSIEKARFLKKKYKALKAFDNLDEMLGDKNIDLIYIASPNSLHFEQTRKALNSGKNVICEKPFFTNTKEFDLVKEIADRKSLILFEAISIRYLPAIKKLKAYLEKIGPISTVLINYSQYSSRFDSYKKGKVENIFKSEFSAGSLSDLGIYNIHLAHYLFGMPEDFSYFGNINPYGIDLAGSAILKYKDFILTFTCAKDTFSENFILIQGQNGHIKVRGNIQQARSMQVRIKDETKEIVLKDEKNLYYYELKYLLDNFYKREAFQKDLKNSRQVLEIFEKLKKSAGIRDVYNFIEP